MYKEAHFQAVTKAGFNQKMFLDCLSKDMFSSLAESLLKTFYVPVQTVIRSHCTSTVAKICFSDKLRKFLVLNYGDVKWILY